MTTCHCVFKLNLGNTWLGWHKGLPCKREIHGLNGGTGHMNRHPLMTDSCFRAWKTRLENTDNKAGCRPPALSWRLAAVRALGGSTGVPEPNEDWGENATSSTGFQGEMEFNLIFCEHGTFPHCPSRAVMGEHEYPFLSERLGLLG